VSSEVASPVRLEELGPQVVAELLEWMSGVIVAEEEEDVSVASVAKLAVAESRVALGMDETEVVMVRLPKGNRRRVNGGEGSEAEESDVEVVEEEIIVAPSIPRKLKGMVVVEGAPVGPQGMESTWRRVVNSRFSMFFNPSWCYAGKYKKWPMPCSGRSGYARIARGDSTVWHVFHCKWAWSGLSLPLNPLTVEPAWCVSTRVSDS